MKGAGKKPAQTGDDEMPPERTSFRKGEEMRGGRAQVGSSGRPTFQRTPQVGEESVSRVV